MRTDKKWRCHSAAAPDASDESKLRGVIRYKKLGPLFDNAEEHICHFGRFGSSFMKLHFVRLRTKACGCARPDIDAYEAYVRRHIVSIFFMNMQFVPLQPRLPAARD